MNRNRAFVPSALLALALAAPVQAGIVFFPVTDLVATDPGNTTLRQLDTGRYELKTRGLALIGTACDAHGHCASVDVAQDLRIAIDFTSGGVSGQSQGEVDLGDTAWYFQGAVDGKAECVPSTQGACATVKVRLRTQVHLDQTGGSPVGMVELEWTGTIARTSMPTWERIEGSADVVMFHNESGTHPFVMGSLLAVGVWDDTDVIH